MRLIALVCVLLGMALPAAVRAGVGDRSALEIEFDQLTDAIARGDCGEGLSEARRVTSRGAFKGFPEQARGAIWTFAAVCAERKGLYDEALGYARAASALPDASAGVWALRFRIAAEARQLEDVATAVETLSHAKPDAMALFPIATFRDFRTAAVAAGRPELALRVYAALEAANYAPLDAPTEGADPVWLDYAGLLAASGDARHANAVLGRLSFVGGLIAARLDGRFTAAMAAEPARFDLKAAAQRTLDRDRADMATNRDRLAGVIRVSRDLLALERYDEALALTQGALDRVAQAPKGKPPFVDAARYLNWLYDDKSRALMRLGRFDEAVQAQRDGARVSELGKPSVSERISLAGNLAGALNDLGRPDEALAALKPFDAGRSARPYGEGWVRANRACALQQLGRAAEAAPDLAWLAAHRRDNAAAALQALICAGSPGDIAAELIAELNDPDQRQAALVRLSTFDEPPVPPPVLAAQLALLATVRARPDVQAAIAAAGHVEHIPLCRCAYLAAS